jgi:hypothetical protein
VEMAADNSKKYTTQKDFARSKNTHRAISNAKNFSSMYYRNMDDNVTISPEAERLFGTSKFTYDTVLSSFVTDIRTAIEFENIELEREISRLNKEMENQSENVFQFNSSMEEAKQQQHETNLLLGNGSTVATSDTADSQQYCRLCNKQVSHTRDPPTMLSSASLGRLSSGRRSSDLCVDCTEQRARREGKLSGGGGSLSSSSAHSQTMHQPAKHAITDRMARMTVSPLPLTALNVAAAASHNNGDNNNGGIQSNQLSSANSSTTATPRSGSHGGTTSRFRSRLNTARDELFLSDDF